MSATLDRSGTVDLRDAPFTIPEVVVVPVEPPDQRKVLQRRRRLIVAGVVGLAAAVVLHVVVGIVMAGQRQRHLAHEFTVADPDITPGEPAMVLQAPKIGLNLVVAEGASSNELRGGPGRVIGSANLSDAGNVVVLGRRTRFGASFGRLAELADGDSIVAKSRGGEVRQYTVESVKKYDSTSVRPLRSDEDRLTLVTSASGIVPDRRLVVVARALAPPATKAPDPGSGTTGDAQVDPEPVRLGVEALDERSTSVIGLLLAIVLLGAAVVGTVLGVLRLRETYRTWTVVQVIVPIASLVVIVLFIIGDSVLPTTY